MKKQRKIYFTTNAKHLGIFAKIIIIVLVIGIFFSNINFAAFATLLPQEANNVETTEDVTRDLSKLKRIKEVEYLRTPDSKTYLKENGLLETDVYGESVHYLENGVYKEIDNTLELISNTYVNKANSYLFSLPKVLDNNKKISLKYKDKEIKFYYDYSNIHGIIQNSISRNKTNLKDEISYQISNNEKLQYILKQNSIKENIILNNYVENYSYSYFIDTTLRLERIGNEMHFFDGLEEIFMMNEYYMFDANNQKSNDINFDIEVVDNTKYKITVIPSSTFLIDAAYPVVIDPEINLMDGGLMEGIARVYSVDKEKNTSKIMFDNNFTIANRDASTSNDDLVVNLDICIPRQYSPSIENIITKNQLMYADITLTTLSTNATNDTKVKMKYGNYLVDEVIFHNSNSFKHKFNIIDVLNDEIVRFTYNNVKYLYLKNLQKDIIGIIDSNNNIVVKYYYNAYGKIINTVDFSRINLSEINPFRYRSYYQDDETGWYYLNSRYYDVETLRFITMDDIDYLGASGSVLSYNLFSYCENNPVIRTDYSGNSSVVEFGMQLYVNVSWVGCGLEIVWFPSTQVSIGGNSRWMPYIYFFSEAGMGGSSKKINELLKEILKNQINFLILKHF